jgi:Cu+-exporting ATPase
MRRVKRQAMATDPVCGMTVNPEAAAATVEHAGQTYYFCSVGCAAKFRKAPDAFTDSHGDEGGKATAKQERASGGGPAEAIYTCPMHPEVEQVGPGSCPKCGMALGGWQGQAAWGCPGTNCLD